jgi:hypothetical protein
LERYIDVLGVNGGSLSIVSTEQALIGGQELSIWSPGLLVFVDSRVLLGGYAVPIISDNIILRFHWSLRGYSIVHLCGDLIAIVSDPVPPGTISDWDLLGCSLILLCRVGDFPPKNRIVIADDR